MKISLNQKTIIFVSITISCLSRHVFLKKFIPEVYDTCLRVFPTYAQPALSGEFPYMFTLGWQQPGGKGGEYSYKCGAAMIHPRYLLTAAHCLYDEDGYPIVVRSAGSYNPNDTFFHFKIHAVIEHPDYNYPEAYNDIAIIRVQLNKHLKFAYLPTFDPVLNENVTIIGYGSQKFAGSPSEVLLKADLKIIDNEECKKFYNPEDVDSLGAEGISRTQVCAGDPEKLRDACQGDSGGPLVRRFLGVHYILDITSFGVGCGNGPPGVYTRVSEYVPWIQRTIQNWVNHEHAHMYLLRWKDHITCKLLDYSCGLTRISWKFLVLSAHCLYKIKEIPEIYRTGGTIDFGDLLYKDYIEVHDDYEYPLPYHDIALIHMCRLESYYVTPIWNSFDLPNNTLTLYNLHNSTYSERMQQDLLKTTLHTVSNKLCGVYYENFPENFTKGIISSQLCAEDREQIWNLRQGYANGPLIMHIQEYNISNPYLVGLLAVGVNCKYCPPAVFTRLSEYRDWISNIVWPNSTQWEVEENITNKCSPPNSYSNY